MRGVWAVLEIGGKMWKDIHGKKCSCGKQFKNLEEYTPLSTCNPHAIHLPFKYQPHAINMSSKLHQHVIQKSSNCNRYLNHLSFDFLQHVIYISSICHSCYNKSHSSVTHMLFKSGPDYQGISGYNRLNSRKAG